MPICEYCGRNISDSSVRSHKRVCFSSSDVSEQIKKGLIEISPLGVIISSHHYPSASSSLDCFMPSISTLKREFGTWDAVAAWAGLQPRRMFYGVYMEASKNFIIDLAGRFHCDGVGPSEEEYDSERPEHIAPSIFLCGRYSDWGDVLAWAGFTWESDDYYKLRKRERDIEAELRRRRRNSIRSRLASVERVLVERNSDYLSGMPVSSSPAPAVVYDWVRRFPYECSITGLR